MTLYEIYKAQLLGYSADTHTQIVADWLKNSADGTVEIFGTPPLTLTNCKGGKLVSYTITGNTVQDGEPSPDVPVEVQSVGDLVTEGEHKGKYAVPVTVASNSSDSATSIIYLDEPLRKIGDYQDELYPDKVIRRCKSVILDGTEEWTTSVVSGTLRRFVWATESLNSKDYKLGICNRFKYAYRNANHGIYINSVNTGLYIFYNDISTVDEFKAWLTSNNVEVIYPIESATETISRTNIKTIKSASATLSVDTTVQPSNVSVTYTASKSYAQSEQQLTSQLLDVMEGIE